MKKTVLVTATYYTSPSDLRLMLALRTCDAAREYGYPIFVVDGSPDESVRELLREHGAVVQKQELAGMGASRRQALKAGLDDDADVIVWIEPEKHTLVPFLQDCSNMVRGGYDIVIPTRESLESYPPYQELSELRANREIGLLTGRPELDLMFGVRVMSRRGVLVTMSYTGEGADTWHVLFVPILWALKDGHYKIGQKRVSYVHPPEQTEAETGDEAMDRKRDMQRQTIVAALAAEASKIGLAGLS